MKFFIDTANLAEIDEMVRTGIVDGVTTNPSIIAREGKDLKETLLKICDMVEGPVNGEVLAPDADGMVREAQEIAGWHENMVVKIPMTQEGITAVSRLSKMGIKTNVTTVYDAAQALIVAKAGATYVSPFVGRSDDVLMDGLKMLEDIAEIYRIYHIKTQIIAASMRTPTYVVGAAKGRGYCHDSLRMHEENVLASHDRRQSGGLYVRLEKSDGRQEDSVSKRSNNDAQYRVFGATGKADPQTDYPVHRESGLRASGRFPVLYGTVDRPVL